MIRHGRTKGNAEHRYIIAERAEEVDRVLCGLSQKIK